MWKCNNCQEEGIKDKYKHCWNCGSPKPTEKEVINQAKIVRDVPKLIKEVTPKIKEVTPEIKEVTPEIKDKPIIDKPNLPEPERPAPAKPIVQDDFLSAYDSQTTENPPSKFRKILPFLIWLTALTATASFAYLSTQKTTDFFGKISAEAANFNQQKNRFVFPSMLPDRKNQLTVEGHLKGKVLPLNKKTNEVADLFFSLPDDLRPTNPEEAQTLMWLDCEAQRVGKYTDNAVGYQEKCKAYVVEKETSKFIGIQDFIGIQPELSKDQGSGDRTGRVLPEKYVSYLREKQLESERTEMKYPSDSPNHHLYHKSEFLMAFLVLVILVAIGLGWIAYKIKFNWDAD